MLNLQGLYPFLTAEGALEWRAVDALEAHTSLILLGLLDGCAQCVVLHEQPDEAPLFRSPRVMEVLSVLGPEDMAMYGAARSLLDWHGRPNSCWPVWQKSRAMHC